MPYPTLGRGRIEKTRQLETKMDRAEKFEIALKHSLDIAMRNNPERFANAVKCRADAYCWSFAQHMMEKFRERRVYVLTEVIVYAAHYVGVMPGLSTRVGVEDVYEHLGIEPPGEGPIEEVTEEIPIAGEESPFTRFFRKLFRKKEDSFRGC